MTALILLMVLLTVSATGALSIMYSRQLILDGLHTQAHSQVETLVQTIQGTLSGLGIMARTFAESPAVRTFDEKLLETELRALLEQNPAVSGIFVGLDRTGQRLSGGSPRRSMTHASAVGTSRR